MTAPRRSSKAVAKKSAARRRPAPTPEPESDRSGWPGVARFALESWPRTARLCVLVVVVGAVLLLAMRLGFRFWL